MPGKRRPTFADREKDSTKSLRFSSSAQMDGIVACLRQWGASAYAFEGLTGLLHTKGKKVAST